MKKHYFSKCLAAILMLACTMTLTSCDETDRAEPITAYNALQGVFAISGKVYSYSGPVAWTGPPAAIPASYISSVNLAPLGPKTATVTNGVSMKIDFADFVSPDYKYIFTASPGFTSLSYTLSSVPSMLFSNINKYVVSYTPPAPTQKAKFRVMTHYSDNPTGTGNSRIVDETFIQQ